MAQPTSKTAACLCGAVSLTATGRYDGTVLCHCADCKSFSGSAFAYNVRFLNATVKTESGAHQLGSYSTSKTKSGTPLKRYFCKICGSSLYLAPDPDGGVIILTGGTAGVTDKPRFELFKNDKYEWVGNLTSKPAKL